MPGRLRLAALSLGPLLVWLAADPHLAVGVQSRAGAFQWTATASRQASNFSTPSSAMETAGREEDSLEQLESFPGEANEDHSVIVHRDDIPRGVWADFAGRSQRIALVDDPFEESMVDPFEEPLDDLMEMEEGPATVETDEFGPPQDPTASPRTPNSYEPDTSGTSEVEAPSDFEQGMAEDYDTLSDDTGNSNARDSHTGEDVGQSADDLDPQDRLMAEEFAENTKNCEEEIAVLKSARIDSIDLNIRINGSPGEDYPYECGLGAESFQQRRWPQITYMWKASGLCHKPLYFEQSHLERYGHSWGPYLQPIISGAHFFATVPILPYKMGLKTPNECVYTLGYYRPGSCAPTMIDPIGFTWRAALFEAGAVVGAAAVIP